VTAADIQRWPAGSPEQTLMIWWRAIQYNDLTDYLNLLSGPVFLQRTHDNKARTELPPVSGSLVRSKPEITNVEITGTTATVITQIATREPVGTTAFVVNRSPQAFAMVKDQGVWRLADDLYVENQARLIMAAQKATKP
jgi:hypothetical protein